ncbi:MAG: DUF4157 domain-containing protein [Cyanobacteria bacterium P01_D01_bin.6]
MPTTLEYPHHPTSQKRSLIHRKTEGEFRGGTANSALTSRLYQSKGSGYPLDQSTRSFMESRLGQDFSQIRIHTDDSAVQMSQGLRAKAFTYGADIYFNKGQYNPYTQAGKHLLTHELVHTLQQQPEADGAISHGPIIQRQDDPEAEARLAALREKLARGETLTAEDLAFFKRYLANEVGKQLGELLKRSGLLPEQEQRASGLQVSISNDPSASPRNFARQFRANLTLKLTEGIGAVASSLEGSASADVDVVATAADRTIVITVAPPTEDNRLAGIIRQQLFPNGEPRRFGFDYEVFQNNNFWLTMSGSTRLLSDFTIILTGPETESKSTSGNVIVLAHNSLPNGLALTLKLSPVTRRENIADTQRESPNDHWSLTPNPRVFATGGISNFGGATNFTSTFGADFPLAYDIDQPLFYVGLGIRGGVDTLGSGRLGGSLLGGWNFNPLTLQAGFGLGVAFLPEGVPASDSPSQAVLFSEIEGMVVYRILSNLELQLLLSAGGGFGEFFGSGQAGASFRF